jgi:transcriptional regulator with XRE-family HTH domain
VATDHTTRPSAAETAAKRARLLATLIGELLHVARLEHRKSEQEAADRAKTSRNTLRKVERGNPAVSMGTVLALCATLGVALPAVTGERDIQEQIRMARLRRDALPKRVRDSKKDESFDAF